MGEHTEVVDFTTGTKYGQRDPSGVFIGIGSKSTFLIDPRLSGNKVAQESRFVCTLRR